MSKYQVRHSLLIARIDLVRRWRLINTDVLRFGVVALGFGLLFIGALVIALHGGYTAGKTVLNGQLSAYRADARGLAAVVWVLVSAVTSFRTIDVYADIEGCDLLFTTVSTSEVLGGVVLSQFALVFATLGFPAVSGASAFAVGSNRPTAFVTITLVTTLLLAVASAVGVVVGLLVLYIATFVPVSEKYRDLLMWLPVVGLIIIQVFYNGTALVDRTAVVLGTTPLGAFGEVPFALIEGRASPLAILFGGSIVTLAACALLGPPLATRTWTGTT